MSSKHQEREILQIRITYFRPLLKTICVFVSEEKNLKILYLGEGFFCRKGKYLCREHCVSGRAPMLSMVEKDLFTPRMFYVHVGFVWIESFSFF